MAECSVGTLAAKAAPSSSMSWSKDMDTTPTVVHAMHQWVARQPDKVAYTWVDQKGRKEQKLTYRDFSSMAITIADAMLGKWGLVKGDRVLLIYPIGLNFVVAFWACLRAGVVAVPLYPVRQLPFFWRLVEGTITSAPNFGYALAARKTLAEQVASLDLRHVRILMDAAEPVRQVHVDAFLKRHAPAGLPAHAYMPGYGLAEHVIFVTGLQHQRELSQRRPTFLDIRKDIFEEQSVVEVVSRTRTEEKREKAAETVAGDDGDAARLSNDDNVIQLVGCGRPFSTVEGTHQVVPEGRVGEVWITGPSVAKGYWGKPQLTAKNFEARLVSSVGDVADESCNKYDSRKFLRTGDLGFFHDDELFICGRQKDLIIIGGRNISPQDVERDVEESHEDLRRGCSAAFSIEEQGEERMVVVAEGGAYRQLIKPSKSRAQDVTSTLIAFVTKLQRSSMTDLASGQGDTRAMSNIVIACTVAYITIWILEYYQAARGEDLIAPLGKSGTPDALYY
eukprot:gene865-1358_t